ncbi:MAG TPA: hypothetical protein VMZ06_00005 [Candidatus Bathyarchaeia archaeon]|nr:hypothetical protein [Candidatus Bathyarchaeia archaeon]
MRTMGVLVILCVFFPAWGQTVAPPEFHHEMWGRTYYGEGYVCGPTLWRSSLAVADLDELSALLPPFLIFTAAMMAAGPMRARLGIRGFRRAT